MLLVHMINFNQSECILFRSRMIPLKKALWLDVASPHDEFEPIRMQYFVVEWLLYSENSLWDWLLVLVMLPLGNVRRLTARGKIGNDFELFLCHLRTSLVFLNDISLRCGTNIAENQGDQIPRLHLAIWSNEISIINCLSRLIISPNNR